MHARCPVALRGTPRWRWQQAELPYVQYLSIWHPAFPSACCLCPLSSPSLAAWNKRPCRSMVDSKLSAACSACCPLTPWGKAKRCGCLVYSVPRRRGQLLWERKVALSLSRSLEGGGGPAWLDGSWVLVGPAPPPGCCHLNKPSGVATSRAGQQSVMICFGIDPSCER